MSDEPTEQDVEARLAWYAQGEDPLNDAEVASVRAGRCGPLRWGGPCWLMPGHVGPHHCYREDIDAVATHALREDAAEPTCACVPYTIRTDYGTGIEHDLDRSSCPLHGAALRSDA